MGVYFRAHLGIIEAKTSHMEKHKNRLHCKEKMNKKKA